MQRLTCRRKAEKSQKRESAARPRTQHTITYNYNAMQRNLKYVEENTSHKPRTTSRTPHTRFILMLATCNAYRARSQNREHAHTERGVERQRELGVRESLNPEIGFRSVPRA
jgi:hypothetical protein